jgi:hypothetical protein
MLATDLINKSAKNNGSEIDVTNAIYDTLIDGLKGIWPSSETADYYIQVWLNSKTGEAIGEIKYHDISDDQDKKVEENVGDMFDSNYLLLRDRNSFDEQMMVQAWSE